MENQNSQQEGKAMKRISVFVFFLFFVFGFCFWSFAQFRPAEIEEREKWEQFLLEAKTTDQNQPYSKQEAVTEPWRLTLEKDGIIRFGHWKNPEGRFKGYIDSWKYEIAAYRLDKLLELNMIPPTVEKRFQGNRGSCQLMVEYKMLYREKVEKDIPVPPIKVDPYMKAVFLQRAFDNLIANDDRNMGDILLAEDWRIFLIDHSRSFRSSGKYSKKLVNDEKSQGGPKLMSRLPRVFYDKLKSLNGEMIKEAVGEYLTDKEIEYVLIRRDLIIGWLDKRIKELGEDNVLY
jgi:hypothetical protein